MLYTTLLIKVAACLCGLFISLYSYSRHWWERAPLSLLLLLGYSFRFIFLFSWFFLFSGHVSGDVSGYHIHTNWAIEGLIPNRDFSTPYGFFLNYLNLLIYRFWANPISLVLFYQIADLLGTLLIASSLSNKFGERDGKFYIILYCFNPLVISWLAMDGQEELLINPLVAFLFLGVVKLKPALNGITASIMIFLVKASTVLISLPVLILTKQRKRSFLSFAFSSSLLAALPLSLGSTVFSSTFSRPNTSGDALHHMIMPGNIWFLFRSFGANLSETPIPKIFLGFALLVTFLSFLHYLRPTDSLFVISCACLVFTLVYQIFSPYSTPGFLVVSMPFIALLIIRRSSDATQFRSLSAYLLLLWTLLVSLDIPVYFRFPPELKSYVVGQAISFSWVGNVFVAWQLLIVLSNSILLFCLLKILLSLNNGGLEQSSSNSV